ncbi:Glucokinase [Clavibacter michiganensis subsp. michiganensis]|uniref:Glucokinase n=1 Tax=Clavibacter michiganensis subsp. michiganensis TaxID=33013 RepID=A0A251XHP4_CLAMM|nr:Glucokinase [Clavibacter michiganensis subsp. michiganensis]OUE02584.1 Glucokinase [Clavibacter michiganensis subsp. michiganensis]
MHAIGIDIGGTKIAGAVVDELGVIAAEERTPTEASSPDAIVEAVVGMVERLRALHPDVVAVGVAAAGFIDAAQSTVYYAPNINWRNEPVREKLRGRIDLPIVIENDANAAGWAEFRYGAGRLVSDMVTLTIGTGVGGAIVADDRLFRGGFGAGAELGHMRVVPDGLPCGCGARGCIEQYGSGRALLRTADELADLGGTHGRASPPAAARWARSPGTTSATSSRPATPAPSSPSAASAAGSARPPRASARSSIPRCS